MIEFAGYAIDEKQRKLLLDGNVVPIGGRAFDVLLTLALANGSVVTRDDLMAAVWPDQIINDNALEAQIHAVRRALGVHKSTLKTAAGRGYVLAIAASAKSNHRTNLDAEISELIDRDRLIVELSKELASHRLVTLVGPGGIGKTRLASAVGQQTLSQFTDGVWFIELSALERASLIPTAIAAACGLTLGSSPDIAELAMSFKQSEALLIFDNCEHLIDEVAACCSQLMSKCAKIKILSTSREALRLDGEVVCQIPPLSLASQLEDEAGGIQSPAARLFLSRLQSADGLYALDDFSLDAIAAICRRLDGIPLAIEMAAAVASTVGIRQVQTRLQHSFDLLGQGRRTTTGRQQTLDTTIAWSYNLLSPVEQRFFRCLGVLTGPFSVEATEALVADRDRDAVALLSSLVSKSLVVVDNRKAGPQFKLLEAMRAFAQARLNEAGEKHSVSRRHAAYFLAFFEDAEGRLKISDTDEWVETYGPHINNARSALDWAFSEAGDHGLGMALTAAIEPLWLQLSLVGETLDRVRQALSFETSTGAYPAEIEMKLYTALGCALLYIHGPGAETTRALERALSIAERLDQRDYQFRCLWGLAAAADNAGQPIQAWAFVERLLSATQAYGSNTEVMIATRAAGAISHVLGDQNASRRYLEAFFSGYDAPQTYSPTKRFHFDQEVAALAFYARVLWLQGDLQGGQSAATNANTRASSIGHIHSMCHALAQACIPLAFQSQDLDAAERQIAQLQDMSKSRGLLVWGVWSRAFEAKLDIAHGRVRHGVDVLQDLLNEHTRMPFCMYQSGFIGDLALAHLQSGNLVAARKVISVGIERSEQSHEFWCMPELLRISAVIFYAQHTGDCLDEAQALLRRAHGLASAQGAIAWIYEIERTKSELTLKLGK